MRRLNRTTMTPIMNPIYRNLFLLYDIASGSIFSIDKVIIMPATNTRNMLIVTSVIIFLNTKKARRAPIGSASADNSVHFIASPTLPVE